MAYLCMGRSWPRIHQEPSNHRRHEPWQLTARCGRVEAFASRRSDTDDPRSEARGSAWSTCTVTPDAALRRGCAQNWARYSRWAWEWLGTLCSRWSRPCRRRICPQQLPIQGATMGNLQIEMRRSITKCKCVCRLIVQIIPHSVSFQIHRRLWILVWLKPNL